MKERTCEPEPPVIPASLLKEGSFDQLSGISNQPGTCQEKEPALYPVKKTVRSGGTCHLPLSPADSSPDPGEQLRKSTRTMFISESGNTSEKSTTIHILMKLHTAQTNPLPDQEALGWLKGGISLNLPEKNLVLSLQAWC